MSLLKQRFTGAVARCALCDFTCDVVEGSMAEAARKHVVLNHDIDWDSGKDTKESIDITTSRLFVITKKYTWEVV